MILNQILAIEKGKRQHATRLVTDLHRTLDKAPLLSGISRVYQPRQEDGDVLPPESTRVQANAEDILRQIADAVTPLLDVTFDRDTANRHAEADLIVEGRTIMSRVPVSYLLFLEKQLQDLRTVIVNLPTLDQAEIWEEQAPGVYRTVPTQTIRSKKVPRNHVKAEATDRHPAQVEVYYEDVPVGTWTTTKFSGAVPPGRAKQLLRRVDNLIEATKRAREEANTTTVVSHDIGCEVFDYLLAP